jgi:hypothetical protein
MQIVLFKCEVVIESGRCLDHHHNQPAKEVETNKHHK